LINPNTGTEYQTTIDPKNPTYQVDGSKSSPSYVGGQGNNGSDTVWMSDRVNDIGELQSVIKNIGALNPDIRKITITDHFDTYLVLNSKAFAVVSWEYTQSAIRTGPSNYFDWIYTKGANSGGGVSTSQPSQFAAELKALNAQYPGQDSLTGWYP
jgi:hypothetical protein